LSAERDRLADWIRTNLMSDAVSELDVHKEAVAKFLSLTPTGAVVLKTDRTQLDIPTEILLHLIGRAYAAAAGLAENDSITNKELVHLVGGTPGGQRWALARLRDENLIAAAGRGAHRITPSQLGRALESLMGKLE